MSDLPGPLRLTPSFPFAGRASELETLRRLVPQGEDEGLRVALIGGEAGAGKSRLVREFAQAAAADGALVLYGACDAVVRRPYRPFVEALDQLSREIDPADLTPELGAAAAELSRLLPNLADRFGELPAPIEADPDTERHRLHTAVAELLEVAGRRAPLVVIVEDGHWADTPTLLLLRHLAHGGSGARALLVATFRDTEADVPEALSSTLADLRRPEGVVRLRLESLDPGEISDFVTVAAPGDLGAELPAVAAALHGLSDGNAFLMTEVWRTVLERERQPDASGVWLIEALHALGSPEGVREVVGQRLARLSQATAELLELAAVAGPEFDPSLLASAGSSRAELQDPLEEAMAHGMIEEVPAHRLHYRFSHELVRRALYDRLARLRRAELHLRIAAALERSGEQGDDGDLAELAHHFVAAATIDGPERAVHYSLAAGRVALAALAFDEADTHFSAALALGVADLRQHGEAQLDLGMARSRAGRADDAIEALRAAAAVARELEDNQMLAAAAIGLEDACWPPGITDAGAVELLEEALRGLPEGDSELRVMLLAGLGRAHAFAGNQAESTAVREDATAIARALDDRRGLATVLVRSYWSEERDTLGMLAEARAVAAQLGDSELRTEAMVWRVSALIDAGDLARAAAELAVVHEEAALLRRPFTLHVAEQYGATLALCEGRLAEAEAAAERAHEWGRQLTGRRPSGARGIQMFGIRREQGRLAELAPLLRLLASEGASGAWRPGLAAMLAELGMEEEARRELQLLRQEGLDSLRTSLWVASLTFLADACGRVGDAALAALVYPELAPLAGGNVVIGHGVACYGAADRYLGLLAATLGEHERATEHFERAVGLNREMGATTWLAHTLSDYGRMLRGRGREEDEARAAALLSEAARLASECNLVSLMAGADGLGPGAEAAPAPDELSQREIEVLRLAALGHSNREIGAELYISGHTVANHMRSIFRKTGAANRTEATGYAYRRGLVGEANPR